ncbi:MAG: DegV family EDD domain-containing protein [Lachnospiraceae bacterium]|nr:DegV family EDD domain-containing protein [Lachnospiraceae bacterium]
MIKKIRMLMQPLFGSKLDSREKVARMIILMSLTTASIGIFQVLVDNDVRLLFISLPMVITPFISYWLITKFHKVRLASWILVLIWNLILFPSIFIMTGGLKAGAATCFVIEIAYVFWLFQGKDFVVALLLSLCSSAVAFYISYQYPDLSISSSGRLSGYIASYTTILMTSFIVGIMSKFQASTYRQEKHRAEEQTKELEQMARSKDTFFANMSHEIRTPINTIIGLNEMTLREDISDEIAENAINIQNASKMLLTTINDILDLSKLESGNMEIVPVQYAVSTMFSDLVNLIWIRAHQKELEFKVDIDPELPSTLYGDEVRIKQVITNMLTNAIKYTETGSVTLTAQAEKISSGTILLRISVKDTGKGIRKENLEDLFSSFKRVDETKNRNIEGTGLGLSISKQLMDMMGGTISVDSVYHRGSTFTIELQQEIVSSQPIGVIDFAAQRRVRNREKYKHQFTAPNAKVLVVDDNHMNCMVAKKLLRSTEVQVETVSNGKECLSKTAAEAYHVILMDHMMPGMDGEETLKAIRGQTKGYCQKVPVIALTANVMSNADQVYRDMGFDGYLAKPINAALLEASLLQYLPDDLIEYVAEEDDLTDIDDINAVNQFSGVKKRKIAITADCLCDLPQNLLDKYRISLMYFYIYTAEGRFCDISEVSSDSLLAYLKIEGNHAHTSTAEPEEYEYFFANVLGTAEHVIHLTATSGVSDSYTKAMQASKSFDNVTVIDSRHVSSGHGLMVLQAAQMAEEGKSVQEICNAMTKFSDVVCTNFLVPTTETLYRNGKVSGIVHKICTLLRLHPILYMSHNKLKVWKIEIGDVQRINRKYVKKILRHKNHMDQRILFVTHAGCTVRQLDEIIEEIKKHADFEHIVLQKASASISSNCGMGTFGLIYVKTD